jgi:hypothetical protein
MKIITLWQPWATLIALDRKRYETRSWYTTYRGPLAIHAAKRKVRELELMAICHASNGLIDFEELSRIEYPLGAVVAFSDLSRCLRMMQSFPEGYPTSMRIILGSQTVEERAVGLWEPGRYAWEMKNVCPLPIPIPCKGQQGLRDAPIEMVQAIEVIQSTNGGQANGNAIDNRI